MFLQLSLSFLITICIISNTSALLVPKGLTLPDSTSTTFTSSSSSSRLSSSSSSSSSYPSSSTGNFSNSSSTILSSSSSNSTSSTLLISSSTQSDISRSSIPTPSSSPTSSSLSGVHIPSRPIHKVSLDTSPSTQRFRTGSNGVAAPSGDYHGPFQAHSSGAPVDFALSTNSTTAAPNEWPSGVPRGTSVNTITKVPPPIGYNADGPIFGANETLPNDYASGVLSLSYGMGNCSMSPGFDGYNAKSCSCVNRIGAWYHDYATATVTTTSCQSSYDALVATSAQQLGCVAQTVTELAQPYTAPADCCDKCGIVGSAVRLLFWPDKTDTPSSPSGAAVNYANITAPPVAAASSGLVSDGMTFVSPSVYLVFTSIHATASCVARVNSHIPLGPVHSLVTRAYAPEALSTAICQADNLGAGIAYCVNPVGQAPQEGDCFQGINLGWRQINYDELANPPPDSVIYQRKRSCFPSQTGSMDPNFLRSIFLNPQLAFPSDVSDIDPVWKTWGGNTCTAVNLGVADPPSTLGQATALVPGVPAPQQEAQSSLFCHHCPIGPGLHSSAAALVSTPAALGAPAPTAEPAVEGQAPVSPIAAQTGAPVFQHIHQSGVPSVSPGVMSVPPAFSTSISNAPVDDPIQASPQQASVVLNNAASKPEFAPAPVPIPSTPPAITLQPQAKSSQQAVIPQNDPSPGRAVHGAIQNNPVDVPVNSVPVKNNPAPTDIVPLVAATPALLPTVGVQPVRQQGSNLIVAGQTIAPGQQGSIAGHAVSNNGKAVVIDGSSQPLEPTPAPVVLPSINGQPIQTDQNENLVVGGSTIVPGSKAVIQGHTLENQGSSYVLDGSTGLSQPSAVPPNLPIINNQPIQKQQNGNLIVAGSITVPPGVETNIAGQQISNGPSHVEVNGQTFSAVPVGTAAPLLADGGIVHVTSGDLEIGSQTLAPGSRITSAGQVLEYPNPNQVIIDGTTHSLAAISSAQPLVIAGQTLNRASNGGVIVAGSTINPGDIATVSGHTLSLVGSSSIVDDGQTYSIPATTNAYVVQSNLPAANAAPLPTSAITLANGFVVTPEAGIAHGANPTYRLANGAQISAGGSAAIVSGTTYSALPSGSGFLVNGHSTLGLPMVTAGAVPAASAAIYTIGGQVFTANPSGFDIGSMSVAPGGSAVTISGTVVSLDKSDHLRIGTSTVDLSSKYAIPTNDVVSIGGATVTAAPTGFVVDGKSVTPGGSAVTINGTVISLDKQSHLKVGSSTVLLTNLASLTTSNLQPVGSGPATPAGNAGASSVTPTTVDGVHSGAVGVSKSGGQVVILAAIGVLGVVFSL